MSIDVKEIAFVAYPVTDLDRAKDFYGRVIGLDCTMDHGLPEAGQRWIEYDIGDCALAISNIWPPATNGNGPTVALEVGDLDEALERLQGEQVNIKTEILESPGCRFFIISDPDGNDITIHQHKTFD